MRTFILLTFAFLAAGFYELSGGGDFDPENARAQAVEARQERDSARQAEIAAWQPPEPTPEATVAADQEETTGESEVTRAGLDLVSFSSAQDAAAEVEPSMEQQPAVQPQALDAQIPLSELADLGAQADEPLSIAALETDGEDAQSNVAFAGTRQVAASEGIGAAGPDIRSVKGTLVNMRSGPGTDYDVVDQLEQDTEVEILTDSGNGWVELRPVGGGATGWIAEFLLTGS